MGSSNILDIYFPPGAQNYKEQLLKVTSHADEVLINRVIFAKFSSPEEAKAKLEVLQSKIVDGMKLCATQLTPENNPLNSTPGNDRGAALRPSSVPCKRVAYLSSPDVKAAALKKFFNAKDAEDKRAVILTFNSEEEAKSASGKVMTVGDASIQLMPLPQAGPDTIDSKRKREQNENSAEVQNKKTKQDKDEEPTELSTKKELDVHFPTGAKSYKEPLLKAVNKADGSTVGRKTAASRSKTEVAPRADDACKRLAHVGSFDSNPETVKLFFSAKHVHFHSKEPGNSVLVLTFDTEEEAEEASVNVMNLRGKVISLKPFNEQLRKSLNGAKSKPSQKQNKCEDEDDNDDTDSDDDDDESDE